MALVCIVSVPVLDAARPGCLTFGSECLNSLASLALRASIGSRRRILAVELQQIEGEQGDVGLGARPGTQKVKHRQTALVAFGELAVDDAGARPQRIDRRHYERVASCPIVTVAGDQARATVGARRHHPVAVVLDLVNPAAAVRRLGG